MAPSAIPTPAPPPSASPSPDAELLQLLQQLEAPLKNLPQLAHDFEATFHDLALTSTTQFLPTPVRVLPSGDETGQFLALDLGGTNLRVGVVELLGRRSLDTGDGERLRIPTQGSWSIPEHLKSSTAEDLFHWVSERIRNVLREQPTTTADVMELGITFSFPMEQTSHTSALLMPMGKGFTFTNTNDLAALLSTAYTATSAAGEPALRIVSITNDSVATLLSAAYAHATPCSKTAAGIIAGTGTNATCMCPVSKLHASKQPPGDSGDGGMLLNTEWSIRGTAPPLAPYVTAWDRRLDAGNEKPGFQPLEEMVGGRYLGELVRLVGLDVFPRDALPAAMHRAYGVDTKLCGDVEAAATDAEALALLADYFSADGGWGLGLGAAATFRRVCGAVSTRAAALVAAATVGVLGMNDELGDGVNIVVGYTGTILERYPGFKERCEGFMREIVRKRRGGEDGATVTLVEARDGGILGAAVLAAMVKGGST
ncbi:uncharacterized protein H6S33_004812 [Morchella sextelata]|uniref:uncharacterized protein n=1 Tax=Morchella sextelata TaxID=1174677 RepID=UPI001D0579BF|nr:uncharacterized protein H6S33_004812 [Morchella sextelata]KAH0605590.1 hypothetical protein H6S33_004812 [Morchella sextelata]